MNLGMLANNKFQNNLRYGKIVKINNDLFTNVTQNEQSIPNTSSFQTLDIMWLNGQNYVSQQVPVPYSYISIQGYGMQYLPSVGDYVIAAFLIGGIPLILGYSKINPLNNIGVLDNNKKEITKNAFGDPLSNNDNLPFRYIEPGEFNIISKNQAEIYLDKYGNIKLITRKQNENKGYHDRLYEITIGENIIDEATGEKKDCQFEIKNYENNTKIMINSKGEVKIEAEKIILGNSMTQPAVLGNDLKSLLENIINTFNQHTHSTPSGMTSSPMEQLEYEDILSEKVEVE